MTSADKGKTWAPWFDLMFRPAAASGAGLDGRKGDKVVLDDLDTQYQAVVKQNDVATMDRLLAEDFILVTGSGKTYTKADLLNKARSGRMRYSHQEDTDRTVRVWGAVAVVTAKLWEQGTDGGKSFDYTVWFSDTYVRTRMEIRLRPVLAADFPAEADSLNFVGTMRLEFCSRRHWQPSETSGQSGFKLTPLLVAA